jgi:hypothetical protein
METDSPGSDRIVSVLLDDEPGPVYLQAWGGTNTIARALWVIQHEHPDQIDKVSEKAIIYIILDQDDTFREYIEPNWPRLQVLGSFRQFGAIAYGARQIIPYPEKVFFLRPWMEGNILIDHGNLTSVYEPAAGAFRSEGDSPSFMHQIVVGLRSLEDPGFGGWGGRFIREKPGETNVWRGAEDDGDLYKPIWRWAEDFQNDWAARADWCVKSYDEANHPPIIRLNGPADLEMAPGESALLDISGSGDPDGDQLHYSWWHYKEAGSFDGQVSIEDSRSAVASITIPSNANSGETIHLIGEVSDTGKPPLTRYARVIVTVQ